MDGGMNRDFAEILAALSAAGAEFLIVRAHALAAHGRPRATGDLDVWIRAIPDRTSNTGVEFDRPGSAGTRSKWMARPFLFCRVRI